MTNQAFEVLRAVKAVPEDQWFFPNGSIPAVPKFISSVLIGDIEQVAGGISLGPLAAKPKSLGACPSNPETPSYCSLKSKFGASKLYANRTRIAFCLVTRTGS